MKNVLVVSDNEMLVRHIKKVIDEQDISTLAKFEFCFSKSNKNPGVLQKIDMKPIALEGAESCRRIIEKYHLVLSLHCKQIFPACIVKNTTCINFHPGLNPYNRGWYPQIFSIINKQPLGATIHIMDELVDHGPIIAQEEIRIRSYETSLDAYNRVLISEKELIEKNLKSIINGKYYAKTPNSEGNLNSIQDFKSLCYLDLDNVGTLREHIDMLRALTHGDYKNAFYQENERKIYVQIKLTPD